MGRRIHSWDAPPKKKKKKRRKVKAKAEDDLDLDFDDEKAKGDKAMALVDKIPGPEEELDLDFDTIDEPKDEAERVKTRLGIEATECPVCRSLKACECVEEERSFQRRIVFDIGEATARCPRCEASLSVLFLSRPGTKPPFDLSHMVPLWGCAHCHGSSLATVLIQTR